MEKVAFVRPDKQHNKSQLEIEDIKKITDLFTLLVQIDKRQKGKEDGRHN